MQISNLEGFFLKKDNKKSKFNSILKITLAFFKVK